MSDGNDDPEFARLMANPAVQFWTQVAGETLAEVFRRFDAQIAPLQARVRALETALGIVTKTEPPDTYMERCKQRLLAQGFSGEQLSEALDAYRTVGMGSDD